MKLISSVATRRFNVRNLVCLMFLLDSFTLGGLLPPPSLSSLPGRSISSGYHPHLHMWHLSYSAAAAAKSLSRVRLFVTPWTVAYQAPLSMGFSRQEYWSGLTLPSASRTLVAAYSRLKPFPVSEPLEEGTRIPSPQCCACYKTDNN